MSLITCFAAFIRTCFHHDGNENVKPTWGAAPIPEAHPSNEAFLRAFEEATTQLKLCPNRVWSVAARRLPDLMPDRKVIPNHRLILDHENHDVCTFDFCEYSQRDFTGVEQLHECHGKICRQTKYLFSRQMLQEVVTKEMSAVWHLDGRSIIESSQPYMAISHVWADGTGTGAWADGQVNECLYNFFSRVAKQFQCQGIWWDTLCIPKDTAARTKALRTIPRCYQDARITLVHDRLLRNWEWNEETACFGIIMSPWFSRGWTAVELAMSRKVKVIFKGPRRRNTCRSRLQGPSQRSIRYY